MGVGLGLSLGEISFLLLTDIGAFTGITPVTETSPGKGAPLTGRSTLMSPIFTGSD